MTKNLNFVSTDGLLSKEMSTFLPWEFHPDQSQLAALRKLRKTVRTKSFTEGTKWNFYSSVVGIAPNLRVSDENPAARLNGLVADFDADTSDAEITRNLKKIEPEFRPTFLERSLGNNVRLVWVFERAVLVNGNTHCREIIEGLFDRMRVRVMLAGYDDSSAKATQVWTNGASWTQLSDTPMSWSTISGAVISISKNVSFGKETIPLAVIAEEMENRYPGRWRGDFKLNAVGVRFWDDAADCPTGCQVKPDGMLCFTGNMGFVKWQTIFGPKWCDKQQVLHLGEAAKDKYFDGKSYWHLNGDLWQPRDRADTVLALKLQGISGKAAKGETASDSDRVLGYIQTMNRVDGAAPLMNYEPGIVHLDGARILNISSVRALEPSKEMAIPEKDFPWNWKFLRGLFGEEKPFHHFLAWLQRSYIGAYTYKRHMGQAVFLCGPQGNGKSLVCYRIIKPLLGNKIANPFEYFTGASAFNSTLWESPLLAMNDEEATATEQTKQKFLSKIKASVVNPSQTYHPKFANPVSIPWSGRIFVTLNDDPSSIGILPEVNSNTQDKLMFFASRPYAGIWESDNAVIEDRIAKELPFFARWLLDWTPPKNVVEPGRMGVKSYFDPRILELSKQQASAYNLQEIISIWCRGEAGENPEEPVMDWEGTPTDLVHQLSISGALSNLMREWKLARVSKELTTLARTKGSGVKILEGTGERIFRIDRQALVSRRNSGTKEGVK